MTLQISLFVSIGIAAVEGIMFSARESLRVKVTDFGATGNGITDDTAAFKAALAKIKEAGGGTVVVPAGTFRSGPLRLVSGLTLLLQDGATLRADDNFESYDIIDPLPSYGRGREGSAVGRREAFLSGDELELVSIIGEGDSTIDGSGLKWWEWRFLPATAPDRTSPWDNITLPHLIEFRNSMFIEMDKLKLRNSPLWHVHLFACSGATMRNLDIRVTPQSWSDSAIKSFAKPRRGCGNQIVDFRPYNTDGIVPDSSEDITIENVVYNGGDDVIAIKSGWDCHGEKFKTPTKDVTIRNVLVEFTRGSGLAIGSEMSGGVQNVQVSGLQVRCSDVGAIIVKSAIHRGGYVKDIHVKGFKVGNTTTALSVIGKVGKWVPTPNPDCLTVDGKARVNPPHIEGITLEDVEQFEGTAIDGYPVQIGQEGLTIKGVTIKGVQLDSSQPGLCTNAEGVAYDNSFKFVNPRSSNLAKGHNLPDDGKNCNLEH